jgi:hypothetical protein
MTMVALSALLITGVAHAGPYDYGWALSASDTDPAVQTAAPAAGVRSVHLWLVCTADDGAAAAEFDLDITGDMQVLGFSPVAAVLNAGNETELLLAIGGCPSAPFRAGSFNVFSAVDGVGRLCLVPSATNGLNVTVDCDPIAPLQNLNAVIGFSTDGTDPCLDQASPCLIPVDDTSWSAVKGMYR